jgi:hypothetical protein
LGSRQPPLDFQDHGLFLATRIPALGHFPKSILIISSEILGFFRAIAFFMARARFGATFFLLLKFILIISSEILGFLRAFAFTARARFGAAFFPTARLDFDADLPVEAFLVEDFLAIAISSRLYGRTTMVLLNACRVSS